MSVFSEVDPCFQPFSPVVATWFQEVFADPTAVQREAWPVIASGSHTLMLAPTGSGKTLASFLVAINRIMFSAPAAESLGDGAPGVHTLYISPLKALGVDIERNLRAPIAGVRVVAEREGIAHRVPTIGIRSGDTPSQERYRMTKQPPDILITTPESLYLLLTSRAREMLRAVDTVIVDEIHSLVGTKRGAHLFASLERLERLQDGSPTRKMQRIGMSATQRPLSEVARLLGGAEATACAEETPQPRPVNIVEAGRRKDLDLRIEVPVEDMANLGESVSAAAGPQLPSIWPALQPRLVELIRTHRSTMIFVNSRRLAERLSAAINDLAETQIARAHHGSLAKEERSQIEDALKRGRLPAIVATSSLELGIDMGAVDLVIQIEAPPTIAAGMQRVGRAGHQVGATSQGVVFPKYRGDLLACSAAAERMLRGEVEATYYPRNPLDVLAQQIVAMVALEAQSVAEVYATLRGAAPFCDLPRSAFEGVLDLLSGRYPSAEFAELRPRLVWNRLEGRLEPRKGTQRLAIANAGTIPDRGLYGVFLADDSAGTRRVGELDEEMVFETNPGDVFLLGASSWRVVEITHDRVLVVPAPGEPGRMPFWRGDGPGRPLEFGKAIGKLTARLAGLDAAAGVALLTQEHCLEPGAAANLVRYIHDQSAVTEEVPSDRSIVVECFVDEVGDWRVCVLTPFGARVHAPWAHVVADRLREGGGGEVDVMWSDDGMVFRLLESERPPELDLFFPAADEIEELVIKQLSGTALFAARFRENAARALLLPKRQPGRRTPLWLQRRKSADLLQVAARYERFPMLLETYRECLRDVFDLPGLKQVLRDVAGRGIRVRQQVSERPSPFAAALLFHFAGNYLYQGDAPLAERRAAALALDHTQLRELLGDAELRELLDAEVIDTMAFELQRLGTPYPLQGRDAVHDLLLQLGDLSRQEIVARAADAEPWIDELVAARRIVEIRIAGECRLIAAEDVGRYRDALGVVPPIGLPAAFLDESVEPLADLVSRFARTHVPFTTEHIAARWAMGTAPIRSVLSRLAEQHRVVSGEFTPGGQGGEWCDANVLKRIKRRSLARLRAEIEPVDVSDLGNFLLHWQGVTRKRQGLDGLLDVLEQLQGCVLSAHTLIRDILPARVKTFQAKDLDELCLAGEVVWRGFAPLTSSDGRIALYLTDHASRLAPPAVALEDGIDAEVHGVLSDRGAIYFDELVATLGVFRNDVLDALWRLVWGGHVTNDTLTPLRSLGRERRGLTKRRGTRGGRFRSRRAVTLAGSEGRWSLFRYPESAGSVTARQAALAAQLIERYGVVTRELVRSEGWEGGFSGFYPVFKAMEEAGRVRRGYFVAGQGAAQFAAPGAEDRLRESAAPGERESVVIALAATDPANPFGAVVKWPESAGQGGLVKRNVGAYVFLRHGQLVGYLTASGKHLVTYLPEAEQGRTEVARLVAQAVGQRAATSGSYLEKVDGQVAVESPLAEALCAAGYQVSGTGLILRGRGGRA